LPHFRSRNPIELDTGEEARQTFFRRAVALHQNRILARLRSRHAVLKCNFKRDQRLRPKVIVQLHEAMCRLKKVASPQVIASGYKTLMVAIDGLHDLFLTLEETMVIDARSEAGLRVLLEVVMTCHRIHSQRILPMALKSTADPASESNTKMVSTVAKLSRYWTISKSLLRGATECPLFERIGIRTTQLSAQTLPTKEVDVHTSQIIKRVCNEKRWKKTLSIMRLESESEMRTYVSREASSHCPVHAEVQLLWHYEATDCKPGPRIIGSSKKACFLCNLLFSLHGSYITPVTHGRVYTKWGLPRTDDCKPHSARVHATLKKLFDAIDRKLRNELECSRRPMLPPCESAIFQSAACSYTNNSASACSTTTKELIKLASQQEAA